MGVRFEHRAHTVKPAADIAKDRDAFVEEIEVTGVAEFPPRVVLQCLRSDGKVVDLVFAEVGAHKVSDELLKAVGALRRERQREVG